MESLRAFLASHVVRKAAGPAGGRPVFMGQVCERERVCVCVCVGKDVEIIRSGWY